jgi:hypothetical protein
MAEGWASGGERPSRAVWHYYVEGRSLCGKWQQEGRRLECLPWDDPGYKCRACYRLERARREEVSA